MRYLFIALLLLGCVPDDGLEQKLTIHIDNDIGDDPDYAKYNRVISVQIMTNEAEPIAITDREEVADEDPDHGDWVLNLPSCEIGLKHVCVIYKMGPREMNPRVMSKCRLTNLACEGKYECTSKVYSVTLAIIDPEGTVLHQRISRSSNLSCG